MLVAKLQITLAVAVVFALDHLLHAGQLFPGIERNQRHALGRTPKFADLAHPGSDQHPTGGDQHDFIFIGDEARRHDLAVAFAGSDGDDALGATTGVTEVGEHGSLAVTVLSGHQHGLLMVVGDEQRQHLLPFAELHATHTTRCTAHAAHVFLVEPHGFSSIGNQHDVLRSIGDLGADQVVALIKRYRDDPGLARIGEVGQRRFLHCALRGAHEDEAVFDELLDRENGVDLLTLLEREHVDDGLAATAARALRHFVDLEPIDATAVREAQDVVVRIGDKEVIDKIVILDRRGLLAAPATPLRAVVGQRLGLDVAAMRERHHHVLRRDEVLDAQILGVEFDLRTTLVAELGANGFEFLADDLADPFRSGEDVHQVGNLLQQLGEVGDDLVALKAGQALQAQFEDRLRLRLGEQVAITRQAILHAQPFRTRRIERCALQHLGHRGRSPQLAHQPTPRIGRRRRGFDQGDDFVDIVERHRQTFLNVRPLARLAQFVHRAPGNDLAPVREEALEHLLQVE